MSPLDRAVRKDGGRVISALAATFRDLDLAEEAFADACVRAAETWPTAPPTDPAAWLYAVARRRALDGLRRRAVAGRHAPDAPSPPPTPEEHLMALEQPIPDERLRLIFVCCHPAVAPDARAPLTLKTVCGLTTAEVARAFLTAEPAMAQRLVRAKRKIAEAGVPFDVPGPDRWPERIEAVLSTLEVAYAQAHADAAGAGPHADFAAEMLRLSGLLARVVPDDAEVQALAATIRFAEARRKARLDAGGAMLPLDRQDPSDWDATLNAEAERLLARAAALARQTRQAPGPRALQAAIHGAHAARARTGQTPWPAILGLYDALLRHRPDPVVRVNRAVALAEVEGPQAALDALNAAARPGWLPFHAARAHVLVRLDRPAEAADELAAAVALDPAPAEAAYLRARRDALTAA